MSSGNTNLKIAQNLSKKTNEYQIISTILNEIKKKEQIKIRPFDSYEIFAEDIFNIFNRLILFSYQLSQFLFKKQNYDSLYKQNKTILSSDIKKFFDKISSICKSKFHPQIYSIEQKENFSLINGINKRTFTLNYKKEELSNENIIDKIKKKLENNTNNIILNETKNTQNIKSIFPISSILKNENQKKFINQKSFSQPILHEKKNSNEIEDSKFKKKKNVRNKMLKKELTPSKKEINIFSKNTFNNSKVIQSIGYLSKKMSKKKINLKKSKPLTSKQKRIKALSKDNIKEINYSYPKLPNLNFLIINENKTKSNSIESKAKFFINSGPKPSIYTSYLLHKYKGVIDNYNEIKQNSPLNYHHNNTFHGKYKNIYSASLSQRTDNDDE